MQKYLPKTKVKPLSITLLLWGIIALILIDVLAKFSLVNLTGFNSNVLTILAALFVLVEVGVFAKQKLSGISLFGVVVAGLALLGVISSMLGWPIAALVTIQGMVGIALGVFVIVEIFR